MARPTTNEVDSGEKVDAIQGKDGLVRVVKVLVQGKVYTRGLNTIHPLYIDKKL